MIHGCEGTPVHAGTHWPAITTRASVPACVASFDRWRLRRGGIDIPRDKDERYHGRCFIWTKGTRHRMFDGWDAQEIRTYPGLRDNSLLRSASFTMSCRA